MLDDILDIKKRFGTTAMCLQDTKRFHRNVTVLLGGMGDDHIEVDDVMIGQARRWLCAAAITVRSIHDYYHDRIESLLTSFCYGGLKSYLYGVFYTVGVATHCAEIGGIQKNIDDETKTLAKVYITAAMYTIAQADVQPGTELFA